MIRQLQRVFYKTARLLGDIDAARRGKLGQRLVRRAARRTMYRTFRRLFR